MDAMFKVIFPVLVRVTTCVALGEPTVVFPNVRLVGDRETLSDVPVPVSDDVCGEPGALSMNCKVAVRDPAVMGLNATPTVHDAPAFKVALVGV